MKTGEETICSKIELDGFDYYVSDEPPKKEGEKCYSDYTKELAFYKLPHTIQCKRVIATNNPNIDIPKIKDEVEFYFNKLSSNPPYTKIKNVNAILGYNKAKETYQYTEKDMIEFVTWVKEYKFLDGTKSESEYTKKELLDIWESQRLTTIYYG